MGNDRRKRLGAWWAGSTRQQRWTMVCLWLTLSSGAAWGQGSAPLVGWGDNQAGQLQFPAGVNDATAVAAGDSHVLALRADGTVVAWGDNSYGQLNLPGPLTNLTAIAASGGHCLALTRDGQVVGWGRNDAGQVTVPSGLGKVTQSGRDARAPRTAGHGSVGIGNGHGRGGRFRFRLAGEWNTSYAIECSTNLQDWVFLRSVTNWYGTAQFNDPAGAGLPRRFYRAIEQ